MKPKKEYFIKVKSDDPGTEFFGGVMFHDAMEHFISREYDRGSPQADYLYIMSTHDENGEEYEVLENNDSVPYDRFSKYLDLNTPFDGFWDDLREYQAEKSAEWDKLREDRVKKAKTTEGEEK